MLPNGSAQISGIARRGEGKGSLTWLPNTCHREASRVCLSWEYGLNGKSQSALGKKKKRRAFECGFWIVVLLGVSYLRLGFHGPDSGPGPGYIMVGRAICPGSMLLSSIRTERPEDGSQQARREKEKANMEKGGKRADAVREEAPGCCSPLEEDGCHGVQAEMMQRLKVRGVCPPRRASTTIIIW